MKFLEVHKYISQIDMFILNTWGILHSTLFTGNTIDFHISRISLKKLK